MRYLSFVVAMLVLRSGGVAMAVPPEPSGAADLFVPAVPNLVADDLCLVQGAFDAACQFGPQSHQFDVRFFSGDVHADATGSIYLEPTTTPPDTGSCNIGGWPQPLRDWPLYRRAPDGTVELLGVFRDRCEGSYVRGGQAVGLGLDVVNGILYVKVNVGTSEPDPPTSKRATAFVKISGLPTLLDIILSYQPPSTLSFNVPVRPEGLPAADSFSVYAGNVTTASDLSQATPLECSVPAGRPLVPGEHLTVPDTLADPAPGNGRYYLATVKHGTQIRAGRSSIGGQLQGRDAAPMPACQ